MDDLKDLPSPYWRDEAADLSAMCKVLALELTIAAIVWALWCLQ